MRLQDSRTESRGCLNAATALQLACRAALYTCVDGRAHILQAKPELPLKMIGQVPLSMTAKPGRVSTTGRRHGLPRPGSKVPPSAPPTLGLASLALQPALLYTSPNEGRIKRSKSDDTLVRCLTQVPEKKRVKSFGCCEDYGHLVVGRSIFMLEPSFQQSCERAQSPQEAQENERTALCALVKGRCSSAISEGVPPGKSASGRAKVRPLVEPLKLLPTRKPKGIGTEDRSPNGQDLRFTPGGPVGLGSRSLTSSRPVTAAGPPAGRPIQGKINAWKPTHDSRLMTQSHDSDQVRSLVRSSDSSSDEDEENPPTKDIDPQGREQQQGSTRGSSRCDPAASGSARSSNTQNRGRLKWRSKTTLPTKEEGRVMAMSLIAQQHPSHIDSGVCLSV